MKKIILTTTLITATFLSLNAQARNGIYITAEMGEAQLTNLPSQAQVNAIRVRDTASFPSAKRFSVGYNHDLNCVWGVGVNIGAGRYGEQTYYYANGDSTELRMQAIEFMGVITLHLQKQFDLFTRLGGIRETVVTDGFNSVENHTDSRPEATLGLAYNFTPHIAGTVTYSHVWGLAKDFKYLSQPYNPDANETLIGVRYTF